MLLPDYPRIIAPGAVAVITVQPQLACRPIRLLIPSRVAKFLMIQDIRIGNTSYTASAGMIPGVIFTKKAFRGKSPRLDMGICFPAMSLITIVQNVSNNDVNYSGTWEVKVVDEY